MTERSPDLADRLRIPLRVAAACLLVGSAAYLVAVRRGYLGAAYVPLVALPAALLVVAAILLALASRAALRGPRRAASAAEAVTAASAMGVLAAGLHALATGFHGAVLVMERTPVNLASDDLAGLTAGPLSDRRERDVTVALARLQLAGVGPDGFRAVSKVQVLPAGGDEHGISLTQGKGARVGKLIFNQGVFGFAPRILVTQGGATLLDANVPFRTVRESAGELAFVEDFEVSSAGLVLHGAITLEDLNDDMKGHPRLQLAVERQGAPLGVGTLRPGEAVDLGDLRIRFAGLQRWSEILFRRDRDTRPVVALVVASAVGALGWAVAAWRRW